MEKIGVKVEEINLNEAKIVVEGDLNRCIDTIRRLGYDAEVVD